MEIDTNTFEKCCLYFVYTKSNFLKDTSLRKDNITTTVVNNPLITQNSYNPLQNFSLFLNLLFEKDVLIFQIIDRDKMKILLEKNISISYGNEENEANKICEICLKEINGILSSKGLK